MPPGHDDSPFRSVERFGSIRVDPDAEAMLRLSSDQKGPVTLWLMEAGIDMMRGNLVRRHPGASPEEIDRLLRAWLHHRPGAEHGDAEGRPAPERLARLVRAARCS